eukprot:3869825-Prymnesium_polylepis.1
MIVCCCCKAVSALWRRRRVGGCSCCCGKAADGRGTGRVRLHRPVQRPCVPHNLLITVRDARVGSAI